MTMANEGTCSSSVFGMTGDGEEVDIYTIGNESGFCARIMTRGATLVSLEVPDRDTTNTAQRTDVVLGFDSVSDYENDDKNQYFGCIVGRVCNRIAKGRFTLDGQHYHDLAINDPPNHLHGGLQKSLSQRLWTVSSYSVNSLTFDVTSDDGDEGYPGTVHVTVTYTIPTNRPNVLRITYSATNDSNDQRTPINLTNHSYFNLRGEGSSTASAMDHSLQILADRYTVMDDTMIPTGEIASVEGTDLDFRQPTRIGNRIKSMSQTSARGYDHNFILRNDDDDDDGREMRLAAVLIEPVSKRRMKVMTTEPAMQFYSGNFLMGQVGKKDHCYPQRSALCFETQHYPDSVNHPHFPTTILEPKQTFHSITAYEFDYYME